MRKSGRCCLTIAEHKRAAGDVVPMDLSMLGKGKGKKSESSNDEKDKDEDKKGKGKKSENSKDEQDKDDDKKGKGKANAKATKHFLGYCLVCQAWRYAMRDCWWNENANSGKDTASLELPITPA